MPRRCTRRTGKLAVSLVSLMLITIPVGSVILFDVVRGLPESESFVQTFLNTPPYGNWTLVQKPVFPVFFNDTRIEIGSNWTIVCPLRANHTYHIYCYGEWVDAMSDASTDYDIFVYNPLGEMEGYHTESAGLPEHLGTTVGDPFFTPRHSGNYSFVIRNDPRESRGSDQATFMIIENVASNIWHETFLQGKESNLHMFSTSWAFEFFAESERVEIWVEVPESLDMYQARLYLMDSPSGESTTLNGIPLAWEPGLYGQIEDDFGGYNVETIGFDGVAIASCEFYGQDMLINYTSPSEIGGLYHLVFIGEEGAGTIRFLVKTEFNHLWLDPVNPPSRAYPDADVPLTLVSNSTDLRRATLFYTTDHWRNATAISMELLDNRTCLATVPWQPAGTVVEYKVEAPNVLGDTQRYNGSYLVKHPALLNVTVTTKTIPIGANVTLSGFITPPAQDLVLTLVYYSANGTFQQTAYTSANGTFVASFRPPAQGLWRVSALFEGSDTHYQSQEVVLAFAVGPPPFFIQYATYIYGSLAAVMVVFVILFIRRRRAQ